MCLCKGKGKVHSRTGHEGPQGEQRYSSTFSLTFTLDGGGWSASLSGRSLTPGKTRYPLYRGLGGPQGWSGWVRKISPHTGIQSPDRPAHSHSLYQLCYPANDDFPYLRLKTQHGTHFAHFMKVFISLALLQNLWWYLHLAS